MEESERVAASAESQESAPRASKGGAGSFFEILLSKAPVGIGLLKGRVFIEINDWALELFGYSREEMVGKNTRMIFPDQEEYERVGAAMYAGIERDGVFELDALFIRKNGESFDVLVRGAWFDERDHEKGYAMVVLDISDRKRHSLALESKVQALTRPGDNSQNIAVSDIFDLAELQRIQDAFSLATGVASLITDVEGIPITKPSHFCRLCAVVIRGTEKGLANCIHSDACIGAGSVFGPTVQPCLSGGLLDGGAPIMVGDRHIANWLVGQVVDDSCDLDTVRAYCRDIGADPAEFESALAEVPRMSGDRFRAICEALDLIAAQISTLAYSNVQQARVIAQRDQAEVELRESAERLKAAAEEKEALYRELKHRVKNSMALIAGLVGLEESHAESDEVREVLGAMRSRMESFAVLYDLLGGEGSPEAVPIASYLSRLVDSVSESFILDERVSFDLAVEQASVPARLAAPVGLIVMELATNSLKYAFPGDRRGTVSIVLRIDKGERIDFSVSDDGVGLPEGFDPTTGEGLGMELVGMLVRQFKGSWRAVQGPGARFEVEIPLALPTSGNRPAGA